LAGEIRHVHPEKNITIVHANGELFNEAYPPKLRTSALQAVRDIGVDVLLNDRLGMPAGSYKTVTTLNGIRLDADLVVKE